MKETPVLRHLPNVYRRAGETGAAWRLLAEVGSRFPGMERATKQLLASRYLEHAEYLEDLERLAAPWGLAPWPGETLAAFRNRLRAMIPLYLQGQATLLGLLDLVGAAADADRIGAPILPAPPLSPNNLSDPYTTMARFQPRSGAAPFEAAVVELPPRWEGPVRIPPTGDWSLLNQSYAEPGTYGPDGHRHEHTVPAPVIKIAAGPAPVTLPILAQLDRGQLLLVNRFLPPGASLTVDLEQMRLKDEPGPRCLRGPLETDEDLLLGTADFIGEPLPAKGIVWERAIAGIPWLTFGLSRWRLLLGVTMAGRPPALTDRLPAAQIRAIPAWEGDHGLPAPREIEVRWRGRRAGTFTILFRPVGSQEWQGTGYVLQPAWFREQVERLKPAGTLYLDPADTALLETKGGGGGSTELSLWEELQPTGDFSAQLTLVDREGALTESLQLTDSVSFTITRPEGKA